MSLNAEQKERRLRMVWYAGLLILPLLVVILLMNQDPYHRVQFNEVLEMRKALNERGVGDQVISYLDKRGGRNVSAAELAELQEADSQTIFFMLNSAQLSEQLRDLLKVQLGDSYITRAEAAEYDQVARKALTDKGLYSKLGYLKK